MINYKSWKTLNESMIGGTSILGFGTQNTIGVINDLAPMANEAGKMPASVDMEPEEDVEDDSDDSEVEMKKSKKKCSCDCDCAECAAKNDAEDNSEDETQEESSGLDTYFCGCKDKGYDGSMCDSCGKYTLKESYSPVEIINVALDHYCGDNSNLYKFASLTNKLYKPSKELCESTKVEIAELFNKKDEKARHDLATLYHQIGIIHS